MAKYIYHGTVLDSKEIWRILREESASRLAQMEKSGDEIMNVCVSTLSFHSIIKLSPLQTNVIDLFNSLLGVQ